MTDPLYADDDALGEAYPALATMLPVLQGGHAQADRTLKQFSGLYHDPLTGLLRIRGWIHQHGSQMLAHSGGCIAIELSQMRELHCNYGHAAGDELLLAVITRCRALLPARAECILGARNLLFLWLPGLSTDELTALKQRLYDTLSAERLALSHGVDLPLGVRVVCDWAPENSSLHEVITNLERKLARQPRFHESPGETTSAPLTSLELSLRPLHLFAREGMIEAILRKLHLPAMRPETVLIIGAPQVGKTRLLSSLTTFLSGPGQPVSEVICRPSDRETPYSLLIGLLARFLTSYSVRDMAPFDAVLAAHPWLPSLFTRLTAEGVRAPVPTDGGMLCTGLTAMLQAAVTSMPHIALVHSMHLADNASLAVLATQQRQQHSGLRLVAGVDTDAASTTLAWFIGLDVQTYVMQPLSRHELAAFLRQLDPEVSPLLADRLYAETGGLPLALELALRAWVQDGALQYQPTRGNWTFPPTVPDPVHTSRRTLRWLAPTAGLLGLLVLGLLTPGLWRRPAPPSAITVRTNSVDHAELVRLPAGPKGGGWLYRYEVTVGQYARFCQATGRPRPVGMHDEPVRGVSWEDAAAYSRWVGTRLPTRAEWQRAAEGLPRLPAAAGITAAGSRQADVSRSGCFDLAGNVREWCADTVVGADGPPRHPVLGGTYADPGVTERLQSAETEDPSVGFRCAMTDEPR
jgi:GGDEF domain-containing protein